MGAFMKYSWHSYIKFSYHGCCQTISLKHGCAPIGKGLDRSFNVSLRMSRNLLFKPTCHQIVVAAEKKVLANKMSNCGVSKFCKLLFGLGTNSRNNTERTELLMFIAHRHALEVLRFGGVERAWCHFFEWTETENFVEAQQKIEPI